MKLIHLNNNKKFVCIAFTAFALMVGSFFNQALAQKKKEKVLDGKTYIITLTEEVSKKTTKPLPDEITFKSDKLKSKTMDDKYKFKAGNFTATVDSSNAEETIITFDAELKGEMDDLLTWHGTISGEEIEGSAIWNKKGKTKKSYSFSGSIKKKK